MTALRQWVRARLDALHAYLGRVFRNDLEPGASYVWVAREATNTLQIGELLSVDAWAEPAHMPGEALSQVFHYAVVEDVFGRRRTVPTDDLLWRVQHHESITRAATALGLPMVPTSLRGTPTWRLGSVRLSVADMTELGRLLVLQ